MNHAEIAHRWASQYNGLYTKPKDMTLSGGGRSNNVSFNGPALYSYGTVIGRFKEFKGKPYVLINSTSYSNSTCKHQNHMHRAISHVPDSQKFSIGGQAMGESLSDTTGREIYAYAIERAAECRAQASRARVRKAWLLERSVELLNEAERINQFFNLRKKVDDKAVERLVKEKEKAEKEYAKERAEQAKLRAQRDAEELKEIEFELQAWMDGNPYGHRSFHRLPVRLRVVPCNAPEPTLSHAMRQIETSHGAVIPYRDGRLCYKFCARIWRKCKEWRRNGEQFKVGPYHLDAVRPTFIQAGCHKIDREEIERFAQQEGWVTPSTEETDEDTTTHETVA